MIECDYFPMAVIHNPMDRQDGRQLLTSSSGYRNEERTECCRGGDQSLLPVRNLLSLFWKNIPSLIAMESCFYSSPISLRNSLSLMSFTSRSFMISSVERPSYS